MRYTSKNDLLFPKCDGCGEPWQEDQEMFQMVNENFVPQDGLYCCVECKFGEI